MKREAALKRAFTEALKTRAPSFYMLQFATRAAPDRCLIGGGKVSLLEFKHATPGFVSPGDQELMCMRLAETGTYCRYILWQERGADKRTLVVHPKMVHDRKKWNVIPEAWIEGFNHQWLVEYLYTRHTT